MVIILTVFSGERCGPGPLVQNLNGYVSTVEEETSAEEIPAHQTSALSSQKIEVDLEQDQPHTRRKPHVKDTPKQGHDRKDLKMEESRSDNKRKRQDSETRYVPPGGCLFQARVLTCFVKTLDDVVDIFSMYHSSSSSFSV